MSNFSRQDLCQTLAESSRYTADVWDAAFSVIAPKFLTEDQICHYGSGYWLAMINNHHPVSWMGRLTSVLRASQPEPAE